MIAFDSMHDLINMCYVAPVGEWRCHGAYVWTAYGLGVLILLANLAAPLLRNRQIKADLLRRYRREQLSDECDS